MPSSGPSEACCTRPPVLSEEYKPVGKHIQIAGLDVYTVGPSSATRAVLLLYDALGYGHQIFTGADMLSSLIPDCVVFMPDFFKGEALSMSAFDLSEAERNKIIKAFFHGAGNPANNVEAAKKVVAEAPKAGYEGIKKWGALGTCWGGKLTAMMSGEGTPFAVAGTAHPGMLDTSEADAMTIPYICLLSREDGPAETMAAYTKALENNSQQTYVEQYKEVHGWMAARCDFKDKTMKAEFERGYKKVAEFMIPFL